MKPYKKFCTETKHYIIDPFRNTVCSCGLFYDENQYDAALKSVVKTIRITSLEHLKDIINNMEK